MARIARGLIATLALIAPSTASARMLAETQKAPAVTKQPVSQTVEEGQTATFTAAASGNPTPTVQWEASTNGGTSWSPIPGATATTLTISPALTSESGDEVRATFKNVRGEATSKAATLTVRKAPQITQQPANVTVEEGHNATFEAAAAGSPTPTVQWQTSSDGGATWTSVAGGTADVLTLTSVKTTSSGHLYRAQFKNSAGTANSEAAVLTVQKRPSVTRQPASATVETGQSAVFEAAGAGFPTPTIQWQLSTDGGATWSAIEGATSEKLTVEHVSDAMAGYEYRAVFTNAAGSATSAAATLTVQSPPVVTLQPTSPTVEAGEGASFEAEASGFPAPTVQWQLSTNNGGTWSNVAGATSDLLTIAKTQVSENGDEFRAVFTNEAGSAVSNTAVLTVATNHYNAVAWGQNLDRQLGDGSFNALSDVPVPATGLKFVTAVAAGGRHSLALLANGTVMAWGDNEFGQLGEGSESVSGTPTPVSGVSGVKAIAAGANHSLALLSNGTVMAWGNDESGQLGNGALKESEAPVAVKGLTGVRAIAAGGNDSFALLANGTVMAWGENENGQLGNGTTKASDVPVAVKGLTGVTGISAGNEFALAVLAKGTVEAWGSNLQGQLGDTGVEEQSSVPVAVESLTGVSAVAAGAEHALALLSGGTVMAWGEDNYGEIGNGTTKARQETPVAVSGLSNVKAISAGGQDSVALVGAGSLEAWGIDQSGQLGDGTTGAPSTVPVAVAGLAKAASVSAGGFHMLAYGEPLPTVTSVSPNAGPASGGTTVTIKGAEFTGATAVRFGASEATSFTVESSSQVTATAPPGAAGTVDVTVVTPAGTSLATAADRYTYQLPPTITKLSPTSGPVAGATTVSITGSEFTAATSVTFGGVPATTYKVNSATSITAVAPAQGAGIVAVQVSNSAGASALTSKDHYKYTPTIEAVSPGEGPASGGTSVTVTGTGFALGTATLFKFGTAKATNVSCTSSTTCTLTAPAHEAGTVNVIATVNKAASPATTAARFTYS